MNRAECSSKYIKSLVFYEITPTIIIMSISLWEGLTHYGMHNRSKSYYSGIVCIATLRMMAERETEKEEELDD